MDRNDTVMLRLLTAALLTIILLTGSALTRAGAAEFYPPRIEDYPLPETLTLFGESVPLDQRVVSEMLEREFIISVWDRAQVILWLKRAGRYFPFIEKKLALAGMPDDLKYLAVAESALLTHIQSPAGAQGPWQFMSSTAKRNGLKRDRLQDQRFHFEESTEAALKLLKRLYKKFGTWSLACAAYNCGEARLKREIKEQQVSDYYRLNLPLETERYIFRIAAAKIIMQNPEHYGYQLAPEQIYAPLEHDRITVSIGIPLHITELAKKLNTDFKIIRELNPHFKTYYLPSGRYELNIPKGTGTDTAKAIDELHVAATRRLKKVAGNVYVVRPGDTLSHISYRTGVSIKLLQQINSIDSHMIYVGQKLRLKP